MCAIVFIKVLQICQSQGQTLNSKKLNFILNSGYLWNPCRFWYPALKGGLILHVLNPDAADREVGKTEEKGMLLQSDGEM